MDVLTATRVHLDVFANPKADNASVKAAEAGLEALGATPGYAQVLLHFLEQSPPLSPQLRTLAMSTLRNSVIKRHWSPKSAGKYEVPEADKEVVRQRLPVLLSDTDPKVRSGAAMALGSVANEDWPGAWPGFLDGLVICLQAVVSADGVVNAAAGGAEWLRAESVLVCLEHFLQHADTRHVPLLAATLHPYLIGLCRLEPGVGPDGSSAFGLWLRARSFTAIRSLCDSLGLGLDLAETKAQVKSVLARDLMPILAAVVQALQAPGWGGRACLLKHSATRLVTTLLQDFAGYLSAALPGIVSCILPFAGQAAQAFARGELDVPPEDEEDEAAVAARRAEGVTPGPLDEHCRASEQDEEVPPSHVLHALLGLLQASYCSVNTGVTDAISDPAHCATVASLLFTTAQLPTGVLQIWGDEPDAFLRDESEEVEAGSSMRQDMRDAARDMIDVGGYEALHALLSVCVQALGGALPAWNAGGAAGSALPSTLALSPRRWKVVEAAIYVVGCVRKYLNAPHEVAKLVQRSLPKVADEDALKRRAKKAGKGKGKKGAAAADVPMCWVTVAQVAPASPLPLNPSSFAGQLITLIHDGGSSAFDPSDTAHYKAGHAAYVLGRCLWCASGLVAAIDDEQASALLSVATEGLQPSHSLPIRVAACKALVRLLKRVPTAAVEAVAPAILSRLCASITEAVAEASSKMGAAKPDALAAGGVDVNDTAIILLELMVYTCTYAPQAAAAAEATLTSLLLQLWVRKGAHPELFSTINSGLQTLIFSPVDAAATNSLMTQLPTLVSVLQTALAFADLDRSAGAFGSPHTATAAAAPGAGEVSSAVVLPDGTSLTFTRAAIVAGALPGPSILADSALTILSTMLRRARELLPPAAAGSSAAQGPAPLSLEALATTGRAQTGAAATPGSYVQLPPQLNAALAVACQLLAVTADHKVMVAGAETLTVAVRLAGPSLLQAAAGASEPALSPALFLAVPARLLSTAMEARPEHAADPTNSINGLQISDEAASSVAPLITALLSHARFEGLLEGVVPALLHRLALARLPSSVQRLAHAVGHAVIVGGAEAVAPILAGCTVTLPVAGMLSAHADAPTQIEADAIAAQATALAAAGSGFPQSGLVLFARAVIRYFAFIESPVTKQVLVTALVALLRLPTVREALSAHSVPSESREVVAAAGSADGEAGGPASRTRGKKAAASGGKGLKRMVPIPLSARVLALVIREWNMLLHDDDESEATSDDEDDDEDEEGGGGGVYRRGRAAGTRFVDADAAAKLYGYGGSDEDTDDDGDMGRDGRLLADILAGGDGGLGSGNKLAELMMAAAMGHDDSEDGDGDGEGGDGDGLGNRFKREYDDAEVGQIAMWDEIVDAPATAEEAAAAASRPPLPLDPVVALFVQQPTGVPAAGSAAAAGAPAGAEAEEPETLPHVVPQTAHITHFLMGLAGEAAGAPSGPAAGLVAVTAQELSKEEQETLQAHLRG